MWNLKSKSLSPKDFIKLMNKPDFVKRISKEHKKVLQMKILPELNAFTHAGPEDNIDGNMQPKAHIASEMPQSEMEAQALWETVWKRQSRIIVMLNEPEEESGYRFWSSGVGTSLQFGKLTVSTVKIRTILQTLEIRNIKITDENGNWLTVYHFLYLYWPVENDLPSSDNFWRLLLTVNKYKESLENLEGHLSLILVHCRNKLDQTMVYWAIERIFLEYVRTKKVNIFSTVLALRKEGFNCLSNEKYYLFCHATLYHYLLHESSVL